MTAAPIGTVHTPVANTARVRPRVLVTGAFGQGNPGDESVLDAFAAGLTGCDVWATTPVESRRVTTVDPADRVAVARAALRSDLVIVTATALKQLHPSSGRRPNSLLVNTLAMTLATRAGAKPAVLAGVGAGRLDGRLAKLLTRAVVGLSGEVYLRDEESLDRIRQAGIRTPVRVGADVVWSILPPPLDGAPPEADGVGPREANRERRDRTSDPVVIALSHLAGGVGLELALAEAIVALETSGRHVVAQPWQPEPDGAMLERVSALAGRRIECWPAPTDVQDAAGAFSRASAVIGLRFHSLVAAAAAGVPFVAVAHEPKLAGTARRLGQPAVAPVATANQIVAAVDAALLSGPASTASVAAERRAASGIIDACRRIAVDRAIGAA